jgi:hypothetical protein
MLTKTPMKETEITNTPATNVRGSRLS